MGDLPISKTLLDDMNMLKEFGVLEEKCEYNKLKINMKKLNEIFEMAFSS